MQLECPSLSKGRHGHPPPRNEGIAGHARKSLGIRAHRYPHREWYTRVVNQFTGATNGVKAPLKPYHFKSSSPSSSSSCEAKPTAVVAMEADVSKDKAEV